MNKRSAYINLLLLVVALLLSFFLLSYGEAGLTLSNEVVVWQLRFPKVVVGFLAGGMLASSGLLLQVYFQNPIAGPDLLGINAGSCLGVAIAIMGSGFLPPGLVNLSQPIMAMIGALAVFFILVLLVQKNISSISLIILGLLIASFTSSFISVLVNMTPSLQVKNFLTWSLGSFQNLTLEDLPLFTFLCFIGIISLLLMPKKLNQFIIGEQYAKSMGMNVRQFKVMLILVCSFLVATVTAFCGPVGFIGIIAPHIARTFIKRSDIRGVMPAAFFVGGILALFTEFVLIFTSQYSLATNSILGLIGAPIIALYLYKGRRIV
ncbi:MAG: iron ABC transporter permease [Bdellovibrionales bacterium]|nr:iron ABC transporter permease [Bdellovibrionales bacterium]